MFKASWRATVPAIACLALTGCFLQPGKFDSTLDLRKDGTFTFSYKGQIYLLALSRIAELASKAEANDGDFVEQPCYDKEAFDERPCTSDEVAEQKRSWADEKQRKLKEAEKNSEMMRAMLGGIDPADPEAAGEMAERLRRQAGWRSVTYAGDGLFEVDFALSSKLTHDFAFPTLERFPMTNVFIMANRRIDSAIRIDAPGFAAQSATNPMQGVMSGMAGAFGAAATAETGTDDPSLAAIPEIDGTFRIVTDGQILANNTDEGPRPGPAGQMLEWRITKRTRTAPMALVKLTP
jgi:hypothetical protein